MKGMEAVMVQLGVIGILTNQRKVHRAFLPS